MGYSISWLAVREKPPETLLAELGLRRTGTAGDYLEHPFVGGTLAGGWYLVVARGCDHRIIADSTLGTLSRECEAIGCSIEEHVMWSSASFWKDGRKLWSISHHGGDEGIYDLTTAGDTPDSYRAIRDRMMAEQKSAGGDGADVDYIFEVPLALAQSLTGFSHDKETDALEGRFLEILSADGIRAPDNAKPWWRFW